MGERSDEGGIWLRVAESELAAQLTFNQRSAVTSWSRRFGSVENDLVVVVGIQWTEEVANRGL